MISNSQALSTARLAFTFSVLDKSEALNRFVNWTTRGVVNRHTLADRLLHRAVELGAQYAVENKMLGERSAVLVPLVRGAVVDNDMAGMKASVADVASEALSNYISVDGEGIWGAGARLIDSAVRSASASIAETVMGDHATEKVLATMVRQHGWKPLETYIDGMLEAMPLRSFLARQFKKVLQCAVVENPRYDMSANAEYRLAAGVAATFMSGEADYSTPLRDYAATKLAQTGNQLVGMVTDKLDALHEALGIESAPQLAEDAFAEQLSGELPELVIDKQTTPRDVAQSLILARLADNQNDATRHARTEKTIGTRAEELAPVQRDQINSVLDTLAPSHMAPLGPRSAINVSLTFGGALRSVEAASHKILTMPEAGLDETVRGLKGACSRIVDVGGFQVGETFAKQIKTLDLDLPAGALGYVDSSLELGKALWSAGWSSLGGSSGPDLQDARLLKQLYNTCGQNEGVLREVTRYLDAALAESAVGGPLLRTMTASEPDLLMIDDQRIKLDLSRPPQVRFQVRQVVPFVQVGISVQYKVAAYGNHGDMRQPRGEHDSTVGAFASVHVTPGAGQASPATEIHHMGELVSIFNQLAFDRATGALQ